MTTDTKLTPPGPAEKYSPSRDILDWMMENLKEFGDIYRASMYGSEVYVVSNPHYADHVLRENWQNYRKGQAIKRVELLLGQGLMVSEGELWKSQRKLVQPAFHRDAVNGLIKVIQDANGVLLCKWLAAAREGQSINVTREVSFWVLEIVLRSIFGRDYEKVAPSFNILSLKPARNLQFAQAFKPLREIVRDLMSERRERGAAETDILGMLMSARDRDTGEAMPDGQLVSEIVTLIVAGHETTASTLSWTWYLLSQHPDVEEKLTAELSAYPSLANLDDLFSFAYTRQVIEEAMRLYPPGWLMTRRALNDDQLGDYFVPAGTEVYISPYLIQRNPALWDNPDVFDPDRFESDRSAARHPLATIPFSAGPRKCIGDLLARAEMQIHIMMIVPQLRLRWISGNPDELEAGVNLRCKNDFIFALEAKSIEHFDRTTLPPTAH